MNNVVLTATGDWDTTTLFNNSEEVNALEFHIEINAGEDDGYGNLNRGGVRGDSDILAFVRESETPTQQFPIFPAHIEINTPKGQLIIDNQSGAGVDAPDATTVMYQGPVTNNQLTNVTNGVISILVNVNYDDNVQEIRMSLYKHHTFSFILGNDEIYNITLL